MIIQCEQCKTRFRLDDSRVSDKGVKVRCAKCRHIFTVEKEQPESVPEDGFSSLLNQSMVDESPSRDSSLKSAEAEKTEPDKSSAAAETDAFAGFNFESSDPFNEADITKPAVEETKPEEAASSVSDDDHFAGFNFESSNPFAETDTTMPAVEETKPEETASPVSDDGFSGFNFEPNNPFVDNGGAAPNVEENGPLSAADDDKGFPGFNVDSANPFAGREETASEEPDFSTSVPEPATDDFSSFDFKDMPREETPASGIYNQEEAATGTPEEKQDDFFDFNNLKSPDSFPLENAVQKSDTSSVAEVPEPEVPSSFVQPTQPVAEAKSVREEEKAAPSPMTSQEDLPPLSISSRRRQNSLVTAAIAVIGVLGAAVAAFYGYSYFAQDKGKSVGDTEKIVIKTVDASFVKNQFLGDLLVITGEAQNNFKKPRAAIQIKVMVYGPDGQIVASKNAYAGNGLTKEQLATMPLDKIEAAMANQFGDSLSNLGVLPDKTIPFVIVIPTPPADAKDYGVEPAGSTVATGKQ